MKPGPAPRIDFVLVGAQKAGTTQLNECLDEHPEIFMPHDDVPIFLDPLYANSDPAELAKALAPATPRQRRGIRGTEYLAQPECAERLRAAGVERVLAVLRDPVARAVSGYCWYVQFGRLPFVPAEAGLRRLVDGWTDPRYPYAGDVLELGRYGGQLARYLDVFGRDAVLVLRDRELRDAATFRRVFEFLDVDPGVQPRSSGGRSNSGVYDERRLRWLRLRRRFAFQWDGVTEYTYRPRRLRRPVAFAVSAAVVAVDRLLLARVFGNRKPALSDELTARLRAYYRDDVDALETMLGWDLAAWR